MKRIRLMREMSGRSGRRRGSQKLGTGGSFGAAAAAPSAPRRAWEADGGTGAEGVSCTAGGDAGCAGAGGGPLEGNGCAPAGVIRPAASARVRSPDQRAARTGASRRGSKIAAQVIGSGFRRTAQAKRRDKISILVHQIDDGGVVHRVIV